MGDIIDFDEALFVSTFNSLPETYSVTIKRSPRKIVNAKDWLDEEIVWSIKQTNLNNSLGDALLFNHLLSIVDSLAENSPDLKEALLDYINDLTNKE